MCDICIEQIDNWTPEYLANELSYWEVRMAEGPHLIWLSSTTIYQVSKVLASFTNSQLWKATFSYNNSKWQPHRKISIEYVSETSIRETWKNEAKIERTNFLICPISKFKREAWIVYKEIR